MAVTTTQYALQQVFKIRGYDIKTGELVLELNKLTESTFTNGQETSFALGANNSQVASFDHSKTAMISGASSEIVDGLLVAQLGSEMEELTDSTDVEFAEVLTLATDKATTKYIATGVAGEEIKYAYVLDANGAVIETLTQGDLAETGVFAYATETKEVTFNAGDYPDGTRIRVVYYPTLASGKKIQNLTTNFSKTLRVVADVFMKDVCSDQLVMGQMKADKGKVSGAFEWSLTNGGDPTAHNFECTFLESCLDNKLWDLVVYDEADFS